jgi:hypothetical protein
MDPSVRNDGILSRPEWNAKAPVVCSSNPIVLQKAFCISTGIKAMTQCNDFGGIT